MKASFLSTVKRPAGWLYVGGLCLCMGFLCVWINLMERSPDFAGQFSILCVYLTAALPLLTMHAFADGWDAAGAAERAKGRCLGYLAWHTLGCALLTPYIWLTAPGAAAFTCLLGFWATGLALACVCLWIASAVRRAPAALAASLAALIVLREAPEIGAAAAISPAGVWFARALIRLSPFSLLKNFLNALVDLKALGWAAALCALAISFIGYAAARAGAKRRLAALLAFAVFCAAIAMQPANLTLPDVTDARLTVASEQMTTALTGLDEPVTVYQVAGVGAEDVWIGTYLEKLAERHRYIEYRPTDPAEDAQLKALALSDNSLVVEQRDTFVIVHAEDLYGTYESTLGARHAFELEGALLAALSDATQIDMTYGGVPPGRALDVMPLKPSDARAQALAVGFVLCPAALLLAALIGLWRRRKRAAR